MISSQRALILGKVVLFLALLFIVGAFALVLIATPDLSVQANSSAPAPLATEISIQGTRIASLENILQTDPQNAVSLLLLQQDIEELSTSIEQTQRDIDRLYTIVLSSLIALLLLLVGAMLPFVFPRIRVVEPTSSSEKIE